jgi:hypothetical protein
MIGNKFSMGLAFVACVCFAPCVFGQATANSTLATNSGNEVMSYAHASTLLMSYTLLDGIKVRNDDGDRRTCKSYEERDKKCKAMPEGGSGLMYLLLAGVSCFGAIIFRSRRAVAKG